MGSYGKMLPVTGSVMLGVGGTAIANPWYAAAGAGLVVLGFLVVRIVRPARNPRA